jgi:hypothetical protein
MYYQYIMEFPGLGGQIHVVYAMNEIILSSRVTSITINNGKPNHPIPNRQENANAVRPVP